MKELRNRYMAFFKNCGVPWQVTARSDQVISLMQKNPLEGLRYIDARICLYAEDNIAVVIYGIGSVRNPEDFYEKVNEMNSRYRNCQLYIDNMGEVVLRMDNGVASRQNLLKNILAGFEIIEKVYPDFKEKPLERKDNVRADSVSDLLEAVSHLDGDVQIGCSIGKAIFRGIHTRYGGYRKEVEEFVDAFGFMPDNDVTVYKQTVYVYDDTENRKSLKIFADGRKSCEDGEAISYTLKELRQILREIQRKEDGEIAVLSPDENFELKGATTLGVCLTYMEQPETGERWLILMD